MGLVFPKALTRKIPPKILVKFRRGFQNLRGTHVLMNTVWLAEERARGGIRGYVVKKKFSSFLFSGIGKIPTS